MGKIEGTRYPVKMDAEDAVDAAETIVNELDGQPPSSEVLADALGHASANSGSFITKVADLRNYGILPNQGLKATNLAQRVANPRDSEEFQKSVLQMHQNIPILSKLYEHLNGREPPNKLWSVLVDIADVQRNEAKELEDEIRELYEDMLRHKVVEDVEDESTDEEKNVEDDAEDDDLTSDQSSPNKQDDGGIYLSVDNDEHRFEELKVTNIEIAIKILEAKKQELGADTAQST